MRILKIYSATYGMDQSFELEPPYCKHQLLISIFWFIILLQVQLHKVMKSLLNTLQDYTHPGGGSISTSQDQDIDKHDVAAHTSKLSNAECIQLLAEQINQLAVAVHDLH